MVFHPVGLIPLAGVGAGIIGATVLTPLLAVPVLNVVGFSAAGPVAGEGRFLLHYIATIPITISVPFLLSDVRHARRWDSIFDRKCCRRQFVRNCARCCHGSRNSCPCSGRWWDHHRSRGVGYRCDCLNINPLSHREGFFLYPQIVQLYMRWLQKV